VRKIRQLLGISAVITLASSCQTTQFSSERLPNSEHSEVASGQQTTLEYQVYEFPKSTVHTLRIPAKSELTVKVALSSTVNSLETFARKSQAVAVLNGGFFDASNRKTTSYIIEQGQVVGDPQQNARLMQNPQLVPYLAQILNRSEFRRYFCGRSVKYAITSRSFPIPEGCQLTDALGGGPRLLPEITAEAEGFFQKEGGKTLRDPLSIQQANARTALGIIRDGDLLWAMAAQKPNSSGASGLSLPELAKFLKTLGVEEAINLDGGSSSSFYYQGKTYYGKLDKQGKPVKRPVKSVLILQR
jgi:exopolysaccharide biosynthesis protein